MSETISARNMLSAVRKYDSSIFLQRIESGSTSLGIPDVYFATNNHVVGGWIENKEIEKLPKLSYAPVRIPFQMGQMAWIKRHLKYNDHVYLSVYVKSEVSYFILKGANIKEVYENVAEFREKCIAILPKLTVKLFANILKGEELL